MKVSTQHFLSTKIIKNIQIQHLNECNFENYQFFPRMAFLGEIIELYLQYRSSACFFTLRGEKLFKKGQFQGHLKQLNLEPNLGKKTSQKYIYIYMIYIYIIYIIYIYISYVSYIYQIYTYVYHIYHILQNIEFLLNYTFGLMFGIP